MRECMTKGLHENNESQEGLWAIFIFFFHPILSIHCIHLPVIASKLNKLNIKPIFVLGQTDRQLTSTSHLRSPHFSQSRKEKREREVMRFF